MFEASLAGGFAYFLQIKLAQVGQSTGLNWLGYIQWPELALFMVVGDLADHLLRHPAGTARLLGIYVLIGEKSSSC